MKKILAALIALALCVSFCAVASAQEDWTIFVYICGADLESEDSYATTNMEQMTEAWNDYDKVRFVVQTGGAEYWNNEASPDELDRFVIAEGERLIVDQQPPASMGESDTLADFLQWGLQTFPAAHVGLILWDHGSGSINGVCFDELCDEDSLTLKDIDRALNSVQSLRPQGFDFVGFDACLMSTVETAAMLAPHARYMIASQENEPGTGWDVEAIGVYLDAFPSASGAELGQIICDTFFEQCRSVDSESRATLSVTDLSQIAALRTAFDAYAKDLFDATEAHADFAPIARAIAAAENFGGNNRSEGYTNMVDLGGLIAAGADWSANAYAARAALDRAVIYQAKGPDHAWASGLSVYYPLEVQGSMELSIFKDVCISAYYLGLVNKIAYGFANGGDWDDYDDSTEVNLDNVSQEEGQSAAISFAQEPFVDDYGTYGFTLTQNGLNNTESVEGVVYKISYDEEDCICYGYTSDILEDWDEGTFQDNFDGYWFALPDGQCLCIYLVDIRDDCAIFTSPVMVNGEEKNLRFAWDYVSGEVRILELWDGISDNGISSRPGESLMPGDRIVPFYDAFSMTTEEEFQYRGEEYVFEFGDELSFHVLPDGRYLYGFCINDIYGGYYTTDFVTFTMEDGEPCYDPS